MIEGNPNPDPDHLRGELSHGYNTHFLYKKFKSIGEIVFELRVRTDTQRNRPKFTTLAILSGSEGNEYSTRVLFGWADEVLIKAKMLPIFSDKHRLYVTPLNSLNITHVIISYYRYIR